MSWELGARDGCVAKDWERCDRFLALRSGQSSEVKAKGRDVGGALVLSRGLTAPWITPGCGFLGKASGMKEGFAWGLIESSWLVLSACYMFIELFLFSLLPDMAPALSAHPVTAMVRT